MKEKLLGWKEYIKRIVILKEYPKDYLKESGNIYYDEFNHTSDEYFRGMKERLIQEFDFPEFMDKNNKTISQKMLQEESVAIHVRRGDHMYDNGDLFGSGYFNKSVRYVKSNINNPIFYVFQMKFIGVRITWENWD